jgi:hypothetical protein
VLGFIPALRTGCARVEREDWTALVSDEYECQHDYDYDCDYEYEYE